jgi:hypothetical protein
VVGVAAGAWWLHGRVGTHASADKPKDGLTFGANGMPKGKADKNGVEPGRHAAVAESEYLHLIPWETFKLAEDGTLRISLEARKWCSLGDLDVIALDGKSSENPKFLLSVEPLNPEDASFKPMVRQISATDFSRGFHTTFKLPHLNKAMQVGLFLCKDSGGQGRCNTDAKEAIDLNRAIYSDSESMKKDKKFRSPDRIYYFQYLYLEGQGTLHSFQNPEVPDITFDAVSGHLKTVTDNQKEAETLQQALGRAKRFQQVLRSMPLEQGSGYARVVLPMMDSDHTHCPKVATGPMQGGPQRRPE